MLDTGFTARIQGKHLGAVVVQCMRRIILHVPPHGFGVYGSEHAAVGDADRRPALVGKLRQQRPEARLDLKRALAAGTLEFAAACRHAIKFLADFGA
jgi:hypothetical protein